MEEFTEERVCGLDIWDKHFCRVSCKVLEMLEDAYHVEERKNCVVWYHQDDSKQGHIGRKLLKVEDERSDGVHDLLGSQGTARGYKDPLTMGTDAGEVCAE